MSRSPPHLPTHGTATVVWLTTNVVYGEDNVSGIGIKICTDTHTHTNTLDTYIHKQRAKHTVYITNTNTLSLKRDESCMSAIVNS